MSARDTPKQVRTRASEREPGSPYVAGGPRSMASKVAVNRLRKEYRCLPRIAAPRIAVLPQSTPRHLLRRPATVATAVTVATRLPRRLQCRPPGHRHRCFEPPPFIRAAPLESNLQEWHYVLQGPPDSPYSGGLQHSTRSKVPWLAAAHAQSATVPEAAPAQGRPLRPNGKPLTATVTTESRGVRWRPAPASRRAEQRRRSLGRYHGKIVFPNEYPFKPPSIFMLTPNGRFETGRRSRSP